jgi:hypothetical protein
MFGFAAHRHNPGGKLLAAGLRQFIYFPAGQGEFLPVLIWSSVHCLLQYRWWVK